MSENVIIEQSAMDAILKQLEVHAKKVSKHNKWTDQHLDEYLLKYRSTLAMFYYSGLRCSEVIGDIGPKWKVLSNNGRILSRNLQLSKEWWKLPESDGIWVWKSRPSAKGILKEDLEIKQGTLYIYSKPLKGGLRESPIEISTALPYVDYIIQARNLTDAGDRVFRLRRSALWQTLRKLVGYGSHRFRKSRVNWFASQPDVNLKDMLQWFGWRRSATADFYIVKAKSATDMKNILNRVVL
ncbi:MAG: hypothetical protein ABSA11_07485 [Candidatus Bathyarchaeia archaeon]|jgi:hypothetical protein